MDTSPAFIKGVITHFPEAAITFDTFHVMKLLGEAVDPVRREERKFLPELAGTRYLWVKNPQYRKVSAADRLPDLRQAHLKTGRAYAIKETLKEFWDQPPEAAEGFVRHWPSGPPIAASIPSVRPPTPSRPTGPGSSSIPTVTASMPCWRALTAWCKPPKPKPEPAATGRFILSLPSSI